MPALSIVLMAYLAGHPSKTSALFASLAPVIEAGMLAATAKGQGILPVPPTASLNVATLAICPTIHPLELERAATSRPLHWRSPSPVISPFNGLPLRPPLASLNLFKDAAP